MSESHLLQVQDLMTKQDWVTQSTEPLVWGKDAITLTCTGESTGPWGPCRVLSMVAASAVPNTEDVLETILSWSPALGRVTFSLADEDTWTLGYTAIIDGSPVNPLEYVAAAGVAEQIWSSISHLVSRVGGHLAPAPAQGD